MGRIQGIPFLKEMKRKEIISEMFKRLHKKGWLGPSKSKLDPRTLAEMALKKGGVLYRSEVMSQLAMERSVHAEMAALTDAARRTIAVGGCYLYTTTFPCQNCAKHIIASGIAKCVYVEPYPKSRALELHNDALLTEHVDAAEETKKTVLEPFMGIAPRQYLDLFTPIQRMSESGEMISFNPQTAKPKMKSQFSMYIDEESKLLNLAVRLSSRFPRDRNVETRKNDWP